MQLMSRLHATLCELSLVLQAGQHNRLTLVLCCALLPSHLQVRKQCPVCRKRRRSVFKVFL